MSLRPDGHYRCDRCGHDLGLAAGVDVAAKVSDTDPETDDTTIRQLDFCHDRPDPDRPGKTIQGCRDRVFTAKALRNYHETRSA